MFKRGMTLALLAILLTVIQSPGIVAQAFFKRHVTDDPTPRDYSLGDRQLRVPANCLVDYESLDDRIRDSGDSTRTFKFLWPSLDCYSRERREAFANPATEELVSILARQGLDQPLLGDSIPFRRFVGSIEGLSSVYDYDEETLNLVYDAELDMFVKHTTFFGDQAIKLYVDRDRDLFQIERMLRCGEGDYYCGWYADVCGILIEIDFNQVHLADAKAIYADTKQLFCHDWRNKP